MSLILKILVVSVTFFVGWLLAALQFRPKWRDGRTSLGQKGRRLLFMLLPVVLFASIIATCIEHYTSVENLRKETDKRNELADSLHIARSKLTELKDDFERSQRHPDFQPFINGLAINDFSYISFQTSLGERSIKQAFVVIPTTLKQQRISLSIRNIGNLPADKLSVIVRFPREITLTKGNAWRSLGYMTRTPEGAKADVKRPSFLIDSGHVIDPGAYFSCDQLIINIDVQQSKVVSMEVEVSSLYAEKQRFNIILVFVSGTGNPYVATLGNQEIEQVESIGE